MSNIDQTPLEAGQVAALLVSLGKRLLKTTHHTEWLDMGAVASLCKEHKIQFNGSSVTAEAIESALRNFFRRQEEMYAEGVNAVGYERRVEWELVFMIRMYRYHQDQHPATISFSDGNTSWAGCNA
jgi:hypothetical protein